MLFFFLLFLYLRNHSFVILYSVLENLVRRLSFKYRKLWYLFWECDFYFFVVQERSKNLKEIVSVADKVINMVRIVLNNTNIFHIF